MRIWKNRRLTKKAARVADLLARNKSPIWVANLLDVSLKHVVYVGMDMGLFGKKKSRTGKEGGLNNLIAVKEEVEI